MPTLPAFHSLIQMPTAASRTRRAVRPGSRSAAAARSPARCARRSGRGTSRPATRSTRLPAGVVVMPYGPSPRGAWNTRTLPDLRVEAAVDPALPREPEHASLVEGRGVQVRVARSSGSGNRRTFRVRGSTRTMALRPPSVIHGAPSGPTMTPCGAEPLPRRVSRDFPVSGSSQPSWPVCCAVYQTPAVAGRSDVVRMRAARDGKLAHTQLALASRGRAHDRSGYENGDRDRDAPEHAVTVRDPNVLLTHRSQEGRYGGRSLVPLHVSCRPRSQGGSPVRTNTSPRSRALRRSGAGRSGRSCGRADVDRIPRRPELPLGRGSRESNRIVGKPGRLGDAASGALEPDRAATSRARVDPSIRRYNSTISTTRFAPRRSRTWRCSSRSSGRRAGRTAGSRRTSCRDASATSRRSASDRVTLLRALRGVPLRPVLVDLERAEPAALPHAAVRPARPLGRPAGTTRGSTQRATRGSSGEPARARRDR